MTAQMGSSAPAAPEEPEVILDVRRARVITDRTQLRRLAPYMGREITVGQAAQELGLTLTAAYKLARRFVALKLLRETRQEGRAGRAIRYYRAPAAFFTPFSVLGLEEIGKRNRQEHLSRFERDLAHTLRHELSGEWGSLTARTPSGEPYYELATRSGRIFEPLDDASPVFLAGWNRLTLTPVQARQLQRALVAVIRPYLNHRPDPEGAGGEAHLLYLSGLFLCRDDAAPQP